MGAPEHLQLRLGDFILDVNGSQGDARAMRTEMESSAQLHFIIRRPVTFVMEICKRRGILGLGLKNSSKSTSLVVEAIFDGPAAEWNRAHPESEVRRGDRIVAVNGISGGSRELLRRLSEDSTFALLISRPEGPEVLCPPPFVGLRDRSTTASSIASN